MMNRPLVEALSAEAVHVVSPPQVIQDQSLADGSGIGESLSESGPGYTHYLNLTALSAVERSRSSERRSFAPDA
jgi:hypothetical protein